MKALIVLLPLLVVSVTSPAFASDQAMLDLLEKRCAECHHDDEEPELSKTSVLSQLRTNDKYVVAGDVEKSPLYQLLVKPDGDKDRMPKSTKKKPLPSLTEDELTLVRAWIKGPATAARRFISEADHARMISTDFAQQKGVTGKKSQIRYLSLANLYNERDASGSSLHSDEQMQMFRVGVNKFLNSLSWKPDIALTAPVDEAGTLLRLNLDAYGISPEIWKSVALAYPYRVKRQGSPLESVEKALGILPVMRADYFVFVAAQPPIYHTALRIPGETAALDADIELEKILKINASQALNHPDALRAGFLKSGVSQGNRLIERLPLPDGGYYWRSYDFDPNRQNRRGGDLFKGPLGPIKAGLTKDGNLAFSHDGGELIFSLPNGLQGYMLVDSKGKRLLKAPLNVVTDSKRQDSLIINGISCMQCHVNGMVTANVKDEVRSHAARLTLAPEDRATIERLFDSNKLDKFFAQDTSHFNAAQAKCGYTGGPEPIGLLYYKFRSTMATHQLAAEIGIDDPGLIKALGRSTDLKVQNLVASFVSGKPVSRPDFEKAFPSMIATLDVGTVPPIDPIAYVEFGADINTGITPTEPGLTVITPDKPRTIIKIGGAEAPDPDEPNASGAPGVGVRPGSSPSVPGRRIVRIGAEDKVQPPAAPDTPGSVPAPATPTTPPGRKIVKLPAYDTNPEPALPITKTVPPTVVPPANVPRKPVKLE